LKEIPAQQFNHVILAVPVDNDTIWLENTNNSNPFGYVGTFIQNRTALLVDDSNSRLTRIPALQKEDVKNSRKIELNMDSIGNATVSLLYNFRGINFELYNSLYTQYNQDDQNNFIHNNIPFSEFEMLDWKLSKKNRDAREITLASSVTVKQILKTIGKDSYFPLIPVEMPDFTSPRNRKLPLELPYPINLCDTIIYHLSPGNENITLPANSKLDTKYGSYVVDFIQQSNCVSVIRELMLQPGYISLAEYGDFYNFIAAIKSEDKRKIIIQSK
jgi:hypothetical protein